MSQVEGAVSREGRGPMSASAAAAAADAMWRPISAPPPSVVAKRTAAGEVLMVRRWFTLQEGICLNPRMSVCSSLHKLQPAQAVPELHCLCPYQAKPA
jgi:hypothetical protein